MYCKYCGLSLHLVGDQWHDSHEIEDLRELCIHAPLGHYHEVDEASIVNLILKKYGE
jgi:hypothetical protein